MLSGQGSVNAWRGFPRYPAPLSQEEESREYASPAGVKDFDEFPVDKRNPGCQRRSRVLSYSPQLFLTCLVPETHAIFRMSAWRSCVQEAENPRRLGETQEPSDTPQIHRSKCLCHITK